MGGCASKPKESNTSAAESVPTEQAETQEPVVAQESQNEAPLVDVSEPKEEGENEGEKAAEPEAGDAQAVPEEVAENVTAEEAEEVKPQGAVEESKTQGGSESEATEAKSIVTA